MKNALSGMKATLLIIICSTVLYCCNSDAGQQGETPNPIASVETDTVNYNAELLPILQKKCSPCHFKRGKMYAKMPFDISATIVNHEAGVLKRFKDEQEITLIKKFIRQKSKTDYKLSQKSLISNSR